MAKKKPASKNPTLKKKTNSAKKRPASKARSAFPGLASMKAAGATAIDVHFQGYGDDGCYDYRVVGGPSGLQLTDAARQEVEKVLERKFKPEGEGLGTILLARFDLVKSVCRAYSGDGAYSERLAELIEALKARGVQTVVGDISSEQFSKCKVSPAHAMSRDEACAQVNWFLHIVLDMAREIDNAEELEYWNGTLRIEVTKRRVVVAKPRASRSGMIQVDELDSSSFPLKLS